ncbi:uncharacterized protein LOC119880075 isoform X1 [Canis lupus familiaris]|uniref:uncharacterized protein LOC119880075 isoform X1 n=1 Tax=Canis lupus familiaris TaxID=9615 RepID=UPI0018F7D892|nr:uncharacterized protein LOC119880075 isoform X1 [Canis lupus familiaris]
MSGFCGKQIQHIEGNENADGSFRSTAITGAMMTGVTQKTFATRTVKGSMEVALCRPATLLLDGQDVSRMRQDTGLP